MSGPDMLYLGGRCCLSLVIVYGNCRKQVH